MTAESDNNDYRLLPPTSEIPMKKWLEYRRQLAKVRQRREITGKRRRQESLLNRDNQFNFKVYRIGLEMRSGGKRYYTFKQES